MKNTVLKNTKRLILNVNQLFRFHQDPPKQPLLVEFLGGVKISNAHPDFLSETSTLFPL